MATTPTSTPAAAPSGEQRISGFGRIIGTLINPKETFADIARKPTWLLPVVTLTILGLAFVFVMNKKIDWRDFMRQQIEASPRTADMSAEQKNGIIDQQTKFASGAAWFFGCIGPTLATLFLGLVYWGAFNMFASAGANYKQSMGVVAHASLVGVVSAPLGILIMSLKEYGSVTPENMMASHAGALLSSDAPKWLMSLATSFDVFWIWEMVLLAIGYAAINPKKISTGKAFAIVAGIWAVWVLLKVGGTAALS